MKLDKIFSKWYRKGNSWGVIFFERISVSYAVPKKETEAPFTFSLKLKDVDFWCKKTHKFKKVPNIKNFKFGQYSKWGTAQCT